MTTENQADDGELRTALERIAAIENKQFGQDWEEIEQAREIARAALAAQQVGPVLSAAPAADQRSMYCLICEASAKADAARPSPAEDADVRELRKWLNEEPSRPIDRAALARVLAAQSQPTEQGCSHCRHPLYAGLKCGACGRETAQCAAEGDSFAPLTEAQIDGMKRGLHRIYDEKIAKWERLGDAGRVEDLKAECIGAYAVLCDAIAATNAKATLAAQPQPKGTEPGAWALYVAGMIVAYLGGGIDDERVAPIAGIIERRLWSLPSRALGQERTPSGYNRPPSGEPCNSADWNAGYEAGLADGNAAAQPPAPAPEMKTGSVDELARLLDALIDHDADLAERFIEKHLARLGLKKRLEARRTAQAPAVKAEPASWYDLRPPMLVLGRTYKTISGKKVRMVSISNAGTEYESMADEDGHHRYSRSHSRIVGRCTGSPKDDPLNIPFDPPPVFDVPVQKTGGE